MKAFIQQVKGQYSNINFFTAAEGFRKLGYEVVPFEMEHATKLALDLEDDVVMAGVPVTKGVLDLLGVQHSEIDSYPTELRYLLHRNVQVSQIGAVREQINTGGEPIFLKPIDGERKLFNGHVARSFRDLTYTAAFPPTWEVRVSDVVEFLSEYRVFIHNREIKGCKHYRGDYFQPLHRYWVEKAIQDYVSSPVAYCLDMGVIMENDEPTTALVEVTDASSLGCYGLFPPFYAAMLADRWHEIVQNGLDKRQISI